jgi:signal transduction histidine kinase
VLRVALTRFALLGLGALVVVGAGTAAMSRHFAQDEAVRDARVRTESIAHGIAAPLINGAVRRQDPDQLRRLAEALTYRMRDGSVSHLVVWGLDGQIIWADDPSLVGSQAGLPPAVESVTRGTGSLVVDADERAPHPGRPQHERMLLEVYVGALDSEGNPFIFEAYVARQRIQTDAGAIFGELLPLSLGSLTLLALAIIPLALSLARRIDEGTAERSTILARSLRSWHEERQRLAQELHDGVIQDLSAMSYALPAVLGQLPEGAAGDRARAAGRRMNVVLVRNLRALRSMMIDLAPSGLDGPELSTALQSMAEKYAERGLVVQLLLGPDLDLRPAVGGLVYRTVRESLHNAEKHSGAQTVTVRVVQDRDEVRVEVADDGRGPPAGGPAKGHMGLHLLEQTVRDVGGTLELGPGRRGGAVLRVTLPAELPELGDDLRS